MGLYGFGAASFPMHSSCRCGSPQSQSLLLWGQSCRLSTTVEGLQISPLLQPGPGEPSASLQCSVVRMVSV